MSDFTNEILRDLDRRLDSSKRSIVSGKVLKFDGLTAHCDGFPARVGGRRVAVPAVARFCIFETDLPPGSRRCAVVRTRVRPKLRFRLSLTLSPSS